MDEIKKRYVKKLYGAAIAGLGAFFLIEHIYNFGVEWNDFLGHEYLGLFLILAGFGIGIWANKGEKKIKK